MEFGMFVSWVVVGLLAGWLAGIVMKDGGYGLIGDLGLGLVGSVVGGWIFCGPGRLPGGALPDGVRRLGRGGHCDRRPAGGVGARLGT